jgi:sortase A
MGVRRVIAGVGRTLIWLGILILLFVAYELWGTGISEARDQHRLRKQFVAVTKTTVIPPNPADVPPPPPEGDALAIIKIPKINIDKTVVQGVGTEDLKKGPGHYPQTPLPGQKGNAAIAGHRTTYGHPFYDLDSLQPGDKIFVTTHEGAFEYDVDHSVVVSPHDVQVLDPTPDNLLTLTTCNPRFSASQRLIVISKLKGEARPPSPTVIPGKRISKPGLSGKQPAISPAVAWGAMAALVFFGAWYLGRRWRRLPVYLAAAAPFLILLFFFYSDVARFLPANF